MHPFLLAFGLAAVLAAAPPESGPIRDPAFELEGRAGKLSLWNDCGNVPVSLERTSADDGRWAVVMGAAGTGEISGNSGICQQVVVPMAARVFLQFWARASSTEADGKRAYQEVSFYDGTSRMDWSAPMQTLVHDVVTTHGRQLFTFDVTALAGQTLYLYLGVHGDGNASAQTTFAVDNVSFVVESPLHRVN